VLEPAGPGRVRLRLRLDDLARFSPDAACAVPALRAAISAHTTALRLGPGDGVVLCNTRWLHGREPYAGPRVMLRVLGDPLPGDGILPGFPHRRPGASLAAPAGTAGHLAGACGEPAR
jgi:hypothetical protein